MGFISREIYDGSFTRYLIYPISFFHYKTVTYLTYSLFYACQLILIYILYMLTFGDGLKFSDIQNLLMGTGLFLVAAYVFGTLNSIVELISLWADNIWSLSVMLRFFCYFLGGSYIPLDFFPATVQTFLKFTPFPYLINLPVKTIMGLNNTPDIITGLGILILWSVIFQIISRLVWSKGQYQYTGVGI